jgi:hypothetical protein
VAHTVACLSSAPHSVVFAVSALLLSDEGFPPLPPEGLNPSFRACIMTPHGPGFEASVSSPMMAGAAKDVQKASHLAQCT